MMLYYLFAFFIISLTMLHKKYFIKPPKKQYINILHLQNENILNSIPIQLYPNQHVYKYVKNTTNKDLLKLRLQKLMDTD